jgi:N-acetylglutamate synthase-like GNAT family acetyltransferase
MEIRKATSEDMPSIISLLKASLGEGLMPKSAGYWQWKHEQNPFGTSPVLIATEDDKIIGVRAFMRWRWLKGDQCLESIRAVDTATHPLHQGKGIFSKLTKALLDECREKGWHFVFNTPNEKSKPGYLKMGWQEAGKLPVNLRMVRPFHAIANVAFKNAETLQEKDNGSVVHYLSHPGLSQLISDNRKHYHNRIVTDHTVDSLRWRYENVPVAQYFAAATEGQGKLFNLFFYRIKPTRIGRELRITDFYITTDQDFDAIRRLVKQKMKEHKADYATSSSFSALNILKGGLSIARVKIGPIVTVRNVNLHDLHSHINFSEWSPSLGDLELF